MDRQAGVAKSHDMGVIGSGVDDQAVWRALYYQAVIARGDKGRGQPLKQAGAIVCDRRNLAVHQSAAHHAPAEMLADGLMAKANP